jgi:hypothetical protein
VTVGSAATMQTGVWAADTTYPNLGGLQSTTSGSCVKSGVLTPRGVFYLFYGLQYLTGSGGAFTVSVDGNVATDTITGSATLTTTVQSYLSGQGSALHYVGGARFAVAAGPHTVAVCVISATGSGNDVHLYAFATPPAAPPAGASAPRVFVGGVLHVQSDPTDQANPGTATANTLNQQVAALLAGDGLNATFVDVRNYVDPYLGMLSSPQDGCGISNNPGLHVDDCGTKDLAQAFADAMNLIQ